MSSIFQCEYFYCCFIWLFFWPEQNELGHLLLLFYCTLLSCDESIKLARWDVLYLGMVGVPPDVVPDPTGSHHVWSKPGPGSSSEVLSISDIRLEPRNRSTNSLGTPHHGSRSRRSPTPTWTEGTPSFTESTYSGDQGEYLSLLMFWWRLSFSNLSFIFGHLLLLLPANVTALLSSTYELPSSNKPTYHQYCPVKTNFYLQILPAFYKDCFVC